jgi:hypothetical protein
MDHGKPGNGGFHEKVAAVLVLLLLSAAVWADSLWVGTWVQRATGQGMTLAMTVEEVGGGWKFTYKLTGPNMPPMVITFATQLDGKTRRQWSTASRQAKPWQSERSIVGTMSGC